LDGHNLSVDSFRTLDITPMRAILDSEGGAQSQVCGPAVPTQHRRRAVEGIGERVDLAASGDRSGSFRVAVPFV
jgi:hypothetical protein